MMPVDYIFYFGITCLRDSASERAIGLARLIGPIEVGAVMGLQSPPAALSATGKSHLSEWSIAFLSVTGIFTRWARAVLHEGNQNAERELFFNKDYNI